MKRLTILVVLLALLAGMAGTAQAKSADDSGRLIVVFRQGVDSRVLDRAEARGASVGGRMDRLGMAVVEAQGAAADRLADEPAVLAVVPDSRVRALGKPVVSDPVPQPLPWGVDRVDAEKAWPTSTGDAVKVGIIDTGVDTRHKDLAANIAGGYSAVAYTSRYTDDNGHGTHVAGIVAAVNNSIGVVGVAPKADIYAVKVLDATGSGWFSDVAEGLDWSVANGMDVVNMSIGGGYSYAMDVAVQRAAAAGLVQVAAAGNEGNAASVTYPGALPGVIAVGATDSNDVLAPFSCTGDAVDLTAPGVSVYSTYKNGRYAYMSGTSMASPHVAGAAALVIGSPIWASADSDADGAWDASEVEAELERDALDLGVAGPDAAFGAGRLRADLAVTP